jgi:predicted nucleotidyltransferase
MDKTEAIRIAQRYIMNIRKKYVIEKAYLYGSFAKGTHHSNSDIDLALVFPSISDIIDIQIDLMQMRGNDDLILEPHPFRKKDFNLNHPVVAEILKNGIEITNT